MSNRKITEDGKILIAIKEKINTPDKWCKDAFHTDDGRMCIKGALIHTINGARVYEKLTDLAVNRIGINISSCPIVAFNDRHGTSHKDIMDLLDEAISKELDFTR